MSCYTLGHDVLIQHNMQIGSHNSVWEAALEGQKGEDFSLEGTFMAVSCQGKLYVLNLTASLILEGLSEHIEPELLVNRLQDLFEVSRDMAAADVSATIEYLLEKDIITQAD